MARPRKKGLDYFPFDVDFFSDKKIKRLRARYGNDGITIYMYLLCEIYRSGYYIDYDEDLILDISDELNISENETKQIIKNGSTVVENGGSATWSSGENVVTVKVTNGSAEKTYTVTVTKSLMAYKWAGTAKRVLTNKTQNKFPMLAVGVNSAAWLGNVSKIECIKNERWL